MSMKDQHRNWRHIQSLLIVLSQKQKHQLWLIYYVQIKTIFATSQRQRSQCKSRNIKFLYNNRKPHIQMSVENYLERKTFSLKTVLLTRRNSSKSVQQTACSKSLSAKITQTSFHRYLNPSIARNLISSISSNFKPQSSLVIDCSKFIMYKCSKSY